MSKTDITFVYIPAVSGDFYRGYNAILSGSWDLKGFSSTVWTSTPMIRGISEYGGECFSATVSFDDSEKGKQFNWGVKFTKEGSATFWGIATEVPEADSKNCYCSFMLDPAVKTQKYLLTHCRYLGANKYRKPDGSQGARFAVWAPNAKRVELVLGTIWNIDDPEKKPLKQGESIDRGKIAGGYISDDGKGIDPDIMPIQMNKGINGVWETPAVFSGIKNECQTLLSHRPYMFRITRDDNSVVYRTDLYSRCQMGGGKVKPSANPANWSGLLRELDGTVSCSATVDPETVTAKFHESCWPEKEYVDEKEFWKDEYTGKIVPSKADDMIIYELHLGALGFGKEGPGTIQDAITLLDHIQSMNFNTVELLPLSEYGGGAENWGYATSHYFAIEYGGGGRDNFKFFIKECHRRGIAVIMDVVYNHYSHDAERAEFYYDSTTPEKNIYYWYEGKSSDYARPDGGYIDNMSTAWAPRFCEEMVRKMLISSAVSLVREFHVDGFRVDQTTSIHSYNVLHADGRPMGNVNMYGAKFLRELSRTLHIFKPDVVLMAEDHSDWNQVTLSLDEGGMGFDAKWYSEYYHHLAGDTNQSGKAKLLYNAATSMGNGPLQLDWFAGALKASADNKVVYNESHDEAGNSEGPFEDPDWRYGDEPSKRYTSHRSIVVSVNGAPLNGTVRKFAEARSRFAWGITVLSAGVPMTLFGEEVGAHRRFKYNAVLSNKEDISGMADTTNGSGRFISKFYSDINNLRIKNSALRSRNIDIVHVHNDNRVIAFKRWDGSQKFLVIASLADRPYAFGYEIVNERIESGTWTEVFNSDSNIYNGDNVINGSQKRTSSGGRITATIPFAGFTVLKYENN